MLHFDNFEMSGHSVRRKTNALTTTRVTS